MEFGDYIWNHQNKCVQISTNMPSIGLVKHEIGFDFKEFLEKKTLICIMVKLMAA